MKGIFKRTICILLYFTLYSCASVAMAKQAQNSLEYYANHGIKLLSEKRFANAETPLRQALNHKDFDRVSTPAQIHLISALESSLILQNKYADVLELLTEKLELMESNGMKPSFGYATSLMNVAESLFNMGDRDAAIEITQASITMMKALPNPNPDAIAFAESNVAQFEADESSPAPLYKDLSVFYTKCENTLAGASISEVQRSFSDYLEVGRNYAPEGIMKDVFASAVPLGIDRTELEKLKRIVFIPDANHTSDWCIVYLDAGLVKQTIVASD